MATKKLKSAALQVQAAQSKQDVTDNIRTIGDLQRDAGRLQSEMNDKIAAIQAEYAPQIERRVCSRRLLSVRVCGHRCTCRSR